MSNTHLQPPPSPEPILMAILPPSTASSSGVDPLEGSSARGSDIRNRSPSPRAPTPALPPDSSDDGLAVPCGDTAEPDAPYPCSPRNIQDWTYTTRSIVPKAYTSPDQIHTISPMELDYHRATAVDDWKICSHPEGRLYFRRSCKTVFTNTVLYDDENLAVVERALKVIQKNLSEYPRTPADTEIVIEVRPEAVFYYCASWEKRLVFWPEVTNSGVVDNFARPAYCKSHLRNAAESQFWTHVETFPNHDITYALVDELKVLLNYSFLDTMTSDTTTVPYDFTKLSHMLRAVDNIRVIQDGVQTEYKTFVVARVMGSLYNERFLNYHGQVGAKLNSDDAIHEPSNVHTRSVLFWLLSPWLFWWPSVYLREVENIWVDRTVRHLHWQRFISELREDWERSATPATVLLTANVSFLAIQSIDMGHGVDARSVAQIASYASTLLSLANYITCQVLLRQHRKVTKEDASIAQQYLEKQQSEKLGLEAIAIAFSLPHGLFSWGMLTFLFSICWVFFWQTNLVTRTVLGVLLAFLITLVWLVVYLGWRPMPEEDGIQQRVVDPLLQRLKSRRWRLSHGDGIWTPFGPRFKRSRRKNSDIEAPST